MLQIRNEQLDAFGAHNVRQFALDMQEHIRRYFPVHYRIIGEPGVEALVAYAYDRAVSYGFQTRREICMYLNTMLILGSNFDRDPLHAWAGPLLRDKSGRSTRHRINLIADGAVERFVSYSGADQEHINRAVLRFHRMAPTLIARIGSQGPGALPEFADGFFPQKAEVCGPEALRNLSRLAVQQSAGFGMEAPSQQLLLGIFFFLFGAGLDDDPQFGPLSDVLNNELLAAGDKGPALVEAADRLISAFLKGGPPQPITADHV